jgi:hypothetical protein
LIEFCCEHDSILGRTADRDCQVWRLTEDVDMTRQESVQAVVKCLEQAQPYTILLWASIPCTAFPLFVHAKEATGPEAHVDAKHNNNQHDHDRGTDYDHHYLDQHIIDHDDNQSAPSSRADLVALFVRGALLPSTLVWSPAMGADWAALEESPLWEDCRQARAEAEAAARAGAGAGAGAGARGKAGAAALGAPPPVSAELRQKQTLEKRERELRRLQEEVEREAREEEAAKARLSF